MRDPLDVMDCLRRRVPITLLVDLLDPHGPDSRRILREDGPYDDVWSRATSLCSTSSSSAR
jgi:hypothetical protein